MGILENNGKHGKYSIELTCGTFCGIFLKWFCWSQKNSYRFIDHCGEISCDSQILKCHLWIALHRRMVLKTWALLRQSIRNPQWIRTGCPQGHKGLGTSFNTDSMWQRCIFLNILFWGTFCVVVSVKLPTIHIFFDRPIIVQPDCVSIRFSSTEHGHPWLLSWTFIALQNSIWNRRGYGGFTRIKLRHPHQLDTHHSPAKNCRVPGFPGSGGTMVSQASEDEKILVKNQVTQINWNPMRPFFRLVKWFQFVEHIPHYAPKCHWKMVKLLRNHGMRGSLIFKSKSILAKTFWKIIRRWCFFRKLIPPIYNNDSIPSGKLT